jgi:hypothetical protein
MINGLEVYSNSSTPFPLDQLTYSVLARFEDCPACDYVENCPVYHQTQHLPVRDKLDIVLSLEENAAIAFYASTIDSPCPTIIITLAVNESIDHTTQRATSFFANILSTTPIIFDPNHIKITPWYAIIEAASTLGIINNWLQVSDDDQDEISSIMTTKMNALTDHIRETVKMQITAAGN